MIDLLYEIIQAEQRIRPYTLKTPLIPLNVGENPAQVFLKLENEQYTGSFKARGSMNKILSLPPEYRQRGVVAASTGNHGLGVARAAQMTETKAVIFVPENADASKIEAVKRYGAEVQFTKAGLLETESHGQAKKYAAEHNMSWVSPYNDPQVIAGQGTIAFGIN